MPGMGTEVEVDACAQTGSHVHKFHLAVLPQQEQEHAAGVDPHFCQVRVSPELNKDYEEWAEYYHTVILPAKVKKPKYKSSVENAVGILEKGIFHDLEDCEFFSLEQFNDKLWSLLEKLNNASFKKKDYSRTHYWQAEREVLQPLPDTHYEYMERRVAKVSSDYHIRFDNAYYSVGREYLHKEVLVRASVSTVKIYLFSARAGQLEHYDLER